MISNLRDRLFLLLERGTTTRSVEVGPGLAVGSVKGPVRKDNQDRAFVVHISRNGPSDSLVVAAVLDGMGGMEDGGQAAARAASAFIADLTISYGELADRLGRATHAANDEVYRLFNGRGGTTLTALAFDGRREGCVVHVGDTRLYHRSASSLIRVTTDDTVQGVVQAGVVGKEDEPLDSQLIQFVGIGSDIEPHLIDIHDSPTSMWLLTSDGAHGMGRSLLQGINSSAGSVAELARKITFVADAAGVSDNASVAVLHPAAFAAPHQFHKGTTVEVWTPTDHMELWLERVQELVREPDAPPPLQKVREEVTVGTSGIVKEKSKKRPSQKNSRKPKFKETGDISQPEEAANPQLNITFGGDGSGND